MVNGSLMAPFVNLLVTAASFELIKHLFCFGDQVVPFAQHACPTQLLPLPPSFFETVSYAYSEYSFALLYQLDN